MQRAITFIIATALALALTGCGSLSRDIADDGSNAGTLVWPNPANVHAIHEGGTFPNLANLQQVQAGLDKQQVIALIGAPHFDEGFAGVREWNYLFNFRGDGGAVKQCEYKILFDRDRIARSFYWNPESCADLVKADDAVVSTGQAPNPNEKKTVQDPGVEDAHETHGTPL